MRIYCLCTGNICRSPVAEALVREGLRRRGIEASVTSAGTISQGQPPSEHSVELLARRGIDISAHRTSLLSAERLRESDLVLGMARSHVREAVVRAREVWPRTFTLKEIVRRGEAIGPRNANESVGHWLERAHLGRELAGVLGESPDDDVEDPIGQPLRVYERMVAEVDDLTERLLALAWPSAGGPPPPGDRGRQFPVDPARTGFDFGGP